MKNKLSLSIDKPCSEKWEHFPSTSLGGFCNACNKQVTDFTKMSDEEILDFFITHSPAQSCGRFRPDQLKGYTARTNFVANSSLQVVQAGVLGLLLFFVSKPGYPKSIVEKTAIHFVQLPNSGPKDSSGGLGKMIQGTVKDEYNEPLAGVNIYLKGTTVGTATDATGNFKFPQELSEGDILIFNYIGFETKEYVVAKQTTAVIEIAMVTLYMALMGEVAIDTPYRAKPTGIRTWWHKVKSVF